ncbi:hypothetical protein EVA_18049 [gut metagenome]|uniref:Uncharacterized protein n=1 Tax=gut metagenome TaxID=749906 RepID=J9FW94_9ZZZZ
MNQAVYHSLVKLCTDICKRKWEKQTFNGLEIEIEHLTIHKIK